MFCPKCKSEYYEGLQRCESCDADLVEKLIEKEHPEHKFIEILSTFNPMDIAMIKSILENEEINFYFDGDNFFAYRPFAIAARLMVQEDQVEIVIELIKDLKLQYNAMI
jgi:hypothetical protein